MFLLLLCIALLNACYSAVDRTREDRATGADIVQAVVDVIRSNCIYPNDRLFLRRLAYVESQDGQDINTFRPNFYGGIWQVTESNFDSTKNDYLLRKQYSLIQEKLNIDWSNVSWTDLTTPLYSGLAASLVLKRRFGDDTPGVLERQAEIWRTYYHPEKTSSHFVTQVQQLPVDDCQFDIGFILDESGSIGRTDFQVMLDFVKNVTDKYEIGPHAVEVAVVTFDSYATVEFGFGTYSNKADLHNAIDSARYNGGGTNTAAGIRLARERVFRNGSRPSSTKVALVITDGCSNSALNTAEEATLAKEEGIVLFALGVGSICGNELEAMASDPNCTHVFYLTGFSDIDSLIYEIQKAACRAPVVIGPSPPMNSNDTYTGPSTNYTSTTGLQLNKTESFTVSVTGGTGLPTNNTDIQNVLQVSVNCGIVHVYMSYDNPHPSAALYSDKLTATDGHPAILSLEKTVDGRPLYMTFVGTHLPAEAAGLKNCSDAHFNTTIISVNQSGSEIICRQNGHERECTKTDFLLHEKYKHYLCSSTTDETSIPNPCTEEAIRNNQLFFPHPYDYTKFIKCDYHHKMYITQCPQGERYQQGSHSCGSTTATVTGDKAPLDPDVTNPCTSQALASNEYFFAYSKDHTKFIHCDVWLNAWVTSCPPSLVWNQQSHTCIADQHHEASNPCTQEQLNNGITMFPHPDPHMYIHCDSGLNQWVQSCVGGTVFDFASQTCVWENALSG